MDFWSDIGPYLAIAAALVLVSGFFSGTEVALFALRRIDREQMARSGRSGDKLVLEVLASPRRLIATVLVVNELIHGTIGALTVIALGEALPELGLFARGAIAVAIALPVVILLAEVTAKTLALKAPMAWARAAVHVFQAFSILTAPLRMIVQGLADLLLKPFGAAARVRGQRDLSEEEFRTLVDAGSATGQVDARERRIIHRVFEFSDKSVGQVMTPRDKIVALSYDLPMARLVKEVAARGFSRIPIYQKSLDNIRGILNAKDLLPSPAGVVAPRSLAELLHEPLFVPRTTPIKRLFRTFKQKKVHLAMVVNEYGKVLGLVTMDDLLAQLFGAIRDEREGQQKAALRRGRGGRTPAPGVPTPTPDTGAVPMEDVAAVGEMRRDDLEVTPADLTPPPRELPLDPEAASRVLTGLAELEDERTPPPVELLELNHAPPERRKRPTQPDADDEDADDERAAAPIPVTDVVTGPSGPVKAARGSGES